jgi:hypothetical protein
LSFDSDTFFLSFLIGSVGFGFFIYGKKQSRLPQLIAGLLMMVYPYFTETVTSTLVVGANVGAGLWFAVWMGW